MLKFFSESWPSSRQILVRAAWLLVLLVAGTVSGVAVAQPESEARYRLNPGDALRIAVWREEELSREVIVRPDGRVTFPLIGEVNAAGHTTEEIRAVVVERLVDYIPEPVVTISVLQARGNKVYVIGNVPRPGEYVMDRPMHVMQALALAGGLGQFANGNRIQILRRDPGGEQRAIGFRYSDVESGNRLESNVELRSGDVIIVP